jgi:delta 1-pyrroline-5-carboxylate dehydrogenase
LYDGVVPPTPKRGRRPSLTAEQKDERKAKNAEEKTKSKEEKAKARADAKLAKDEAKKKSSAEKKAAKAAATPKSKKGFTSVVKREIGLMSPSTMVAAASAAAKSAILGKSNDTQHMLTSAAARLSVSEAKDMAAAMAGLSSSLPGLSRAVSSRTLTGAASSNDGDIDENFSILDDDNDEQLQQNHTTSSSTSSSSTRRRNDDDDDDDDNDDNNDDDEDEE